METTHETDTTDVYDDDAFFQFSRNPGRLIACALAATLAVLAVVVVVRGTADQPSKVKTGSTAAAPAPARTVPHRHGAATTIPADDDDGDFFSRLFGDRLDGLYGSESSSAGASSDGASYEANGCPFTLDLPEDWTHFDNDGVFASGNPDDTAAVIVSCHDYDGTPLDQLAEQIPSEMEGLGAMEMLKQGEVDGGYRIEMRSEGGLYFRVTWIVSGDKRYTVIADHADGDEDSAKTANHVADSFRAIEAS
jgi:predicted Zn-dependent protease